MRDRDRDWVKLAIVEFLGPFALVFAGVGAIIQTQGQDLVAVALANGLAIGLLVSAVGHISGGAFNPAVTLGLLAARRIELERAIVYIVAQLLGAVTGAGALTLVYRDLERNRPGVNLGVPGIGANLSTGNALVMEIILTFVLMFVIFGVAIDHRTGRAISGLVIGLTITLDILAGGVVSGAVMNPARAFGPSLIQAGDGNWGEHWIYWVGPVVGAVLAALLYNDVLLAGIAPGSGPSERISPEHPREAPGHAEPEDAAFPSASLSRSRRAQRRRR